MDATEFAKELAALERTFNPSTTKPDKLNKIWNLVQKYSKGSQSNKQLSSKGNVPDAVHHNMSAISAVLTAATHRQDIAQEFLAKLSGIPSPGRPPLLKLPCANQDPNQKRACDNHGTSLCSKCRLVGYCSTACQKMHWKQHKIDCKAEILSPQWRPAWEREGRPPAFIAGNNDQGWNLQNTFGGGMSLWGNVPAIDVVSPVRNEGQEKLRNMDLTLAFVASGDLRNVVRSMNSLPLEYSGKLSIIVNDKNPMVVCQNLFLLCVLGLVDDVDDAAEHALHMWYSIFVPSSHMMTVTPILATAVEALLTDPNSPVRVGEHGSIDLAVTEMTRKFIATMLTKARPDGGYVNDAFTRTMLAPSRVDHRDRFFQRLRPSHRAAMLEWRRFGLLLPFGAPNAHLNIANKMLLNPNGQLLVNDSASPLNGWNIEDVIASGKQHGAPEEDIFGCLYFHVRHQLAEFAQRLRRFHVQIRLSNLDARELAAQSKSQKFDRIEVSNICDLEYVGIRHVLEDWAPLLNPANPHSAIICLFMNWSVNEPNAAADQGGAVPNLSNLISTVMTKHYPGASRQEIGQRIAADTGRSTLFGLMSSLNLVYDNSAAFNSYLKKQRLTEVTRTLDVQMRAINTIAPSRTLAVLGTGVDALPDVSTNEKWYRASALSGVCSLERYVEFVRASATNP
ncbi:hypothetical protein BKA62DRAFT_720618 [Auriculariales sp. MPI-PUGE-AT-0066]|nr:hypothetical protein BKA62DRAFT_720618 [Auriculariales sp. MPI-PUGE-AT-0066]